jgi:hypothetical protein
MKNPDKLSILKVGKNNELKIHLLSLLYSHERPPDEQPLKKLVCGKRT